jgi:hypothetical protein
MSILSHTSPWYAAGLAFQCVRCGRCCAGPEDGYVWTAESEIAAIAAYLGVSVEELRRRRFRRDGGRHTVVMAEGSKDCPFLSSAGNGDMTCAIYPVRPAQCRAWPFWGSNLRGPDEWARAATRCPGINRGPILTCDGIESRLNSSRV